VDNRQRSEFSKDLNRSSGGYELAFVPAIFGAVGLLVDRWLGTVPVIGLVLFLLGVAGTVLKLWLGYEQKMQQLEAEGPWARRS
jgi:F0F1-type ATP synthase assembly protein I